MLGICSFAFILSSGVNDHMTISSLEWLTQSCWTCGPEESSPAPYKFKINSIGLLSFHSPTSFFTALTVLENRWFDWWTPLLVKPWTLCFSIFVWGYQATFLHEGAFYQLNICRWLGGLKATKSDTASAVFLYQFQVADGTLTLLIFVFLECER